MKHLIVEGLGDKFFFEKYCHHYSYNIDVKVTSMENGLNIFSYKFNCHNIDI